MKFARLEAHFDNLKREMERCYGEIEPILNMIQADQRLNYPTSLTSAKLSELIREYCALSFTMIRHLRENKRRVEDPNNLESYLSTMSVIIKEKLNIFCANCSELLNELAKASVIGMGNNLDAPVFESPPLSFQDIQGTFFQRITKNEESLNSTPDFPLGNS
ncbi:hypothetical protein ACNVED_12425 [Legionella sp. D16C41]|uniref:hypothetical protein n=1 Tax=Legionella sp. D16C41 TaxID=3402688 RepID=UPI003AF8D1EC